jgi:hypothetical protein
MKLMDASGSAVTGWQPGKKYSVEVAAYESGTQVHLWLHATAGALCLGGTARRRVLPAQASCRRKLLRLAHQACLRCASTVERLLPRVQPAQQAPAAFAVSYAGRMCRM